MNDNNTLPAKQKAHNLTEHFLQPFHRLRGEVDRIFDEFPMRWPALSLVNQLGTALLQPAIEMTEKKKGYRISVEVPGIEPEAINVEIDGDMLVIKGEKREEHDEEEEGYALSERSYGSFERRIAIPADALAEEAEAEARNGVLKITVPRDENAAPQRRRIEIKSTQSD